MKPQLGRFGYHRRTASIPHRRFRMVRRFALSIIAIACFVGLTVAAEEAGPSRAKLGEKIPNLAFRDAGGGKHALYDLKDQKAIVVVFLSFECPVSRSYCKTLVDLHKELGKHGVSFVGLTVSEDDSAQRSPSTRGIRPRFSRLSGRGIGRGAGSGGRFHAGGVRSRQRLPAPLSRSDRQQVRQSAQGA